MEKQLFALAIAENYKKYFKTLNKNKQLKKRKGHELNFKQNISNLQNEKRNIENQNGKKINCEFKQINSKRSVNRINSFQIPNNSIKRVNNITFAEISQNMSSTDSNLKDNSFQELEMILSLLDSSKTNSTIENNSNDDLKINSPETDKIDFDCMGCFIF